VTPFHPVGEPSVGQRREPLERQGSAGAVSAESLEARDVVLVEPGVGVEGETLDEGRAAARPAGGRRRSAAWHLDALELEDVERSVRSDLLLKTGYWCCDRRMKCTRDLVDALRL
jgi:hypothetical protein